MTELQPSAADTPNPLAPHHLPWFIVGPHQTDGLMTAMIIFIVLVIVLIGNLYFKLHALPERWSHGANKLQMEIVAVLALLALFTHNHIFWMAALLLAIVRFPDFSTPINLIADALQRIAARSPPVLAEGQTPAESDLPLEESPSLSAAPMTKQIRPSGDLPAKGTAAHA